MHGTNHRRDKDSRRASIGGSSYTQYCHVTKKKDATTCLSDVPCVRSFIQVRVTFYSQVTALFVTARRSWCIHLEGSQIPLLFTNRISTKLYRLLDSILLVLFSSFSSFCLFFFKLSVRQCVSWRNQRQGFFRITLCVSWSATLAISGLESADFYHHSLLV